MNPKIKTSIIVVIIVAILALVFVFLTKKEPEQTPLVSVSGDVTTTNPQPNASLLTQDFLSILLNVKNIKLDDDIFNDPTFSSLSDSSILLTPEGTEGRPNPFAPIGSDPQTPILLNISTGSSATLPADSTSTPANDGVSAEV